MTKILFDATTLALSGFHKGGVYRYGMEILQRMPAMAPDDWEWGLYFNFSSGRHLRKMHETICKSGIGKHKLSRIPPHLLRRLNVPSDSFLTGGKHDLFHGPCDILPPSRHAARVLTIHDLAYLRAPEGLPKKWITDHEATVPVACRRAHQIIAVSEFSKSDIIDAFDIDPQRVQVVYHGISKGLKPSTDPEADRTHLKKRYNIDKEYILYLGTLQPNKNIEGLCEAFQIMRGRGYPGQLVLAGAQGWMFDEMWGRIVMRGHDANVLLTGFVDMDDIPQLYGNCSAFALVSFLEGFGIPVIEAMACGAPVVAANACSLIEVAGPAGLLVDPHDAESIAAGLETATKLGPERGELIRAGLEWSATFTWEKTAAQTVAAYRLALESTAP